MKKFLILFFTISFFPIFANAEVASVVTSHAKIDLLIEKNEVTTNEDFVVGIKFDKTKIEKPKTIVIEVFNIATPTVLWHNSKV